MPSYLEVTKCHIHIFRGPELLEGESRRKQDLWPLSSRIRRRQRTIAGQSKGRFRWSRYTALVQMGRAAMGQGRWQQVLACGALGLGFLIFAEIVLS
ncbi:hypothetical protein V6Z12_D10G256300 [Gossypium hirsutum]